MHASAALALALALEVCITSILSGVAASADLSLCHRFKAKEGMSEGKHAD